VAVGDERWRDRKLAGLLTETIVGGGGLRAVVLGMGLNLTWDGAPPPELAAGAVTLEELAGADVDRERLLVVWLRRLDAELELLAGSDGRARLAARARDRSATLGRRVRVERPDGALTGTATDVTASGHLVVAPDDDGPAVVVAVGDVVHLRHRGPAAG
jgi:BirA family biotin operon repressor/biotin-[acetyl-CoA-carboxylase] ligase